MYLFPSILLHFYGSCLYPTQYTFFVRQNFIFELEHLIWAFNRVHLMNECKCLQDLWHFGVILLELFMTFLAQHITWINTIFLQKKSLQMSIVLSSICITLQTLRTRKHTCTSRSTNPTKLYSCMTSARASFIFRYFSKNGSSYFGI